jgi:hypothetical protein
MLEALKEVAFFMKTGSQKGKHFPAKFSSAGPEPENGAGYPAGTGLCRISGRFLRRGYLIYNYIVFWHRKVKEIFETLQNFCNGYISITVTKQHITMVTFL